MFVDKIQPKYCWSNSFSSIVTPSNWWYKNEELTQFAIASLAYGKNALSTGVSNPLSLFAIVPIDLSKLAKTRLVSLTHPKSSLCENEGKSMASDLSIGQSSHSTPPKSR